MSVSSKAVRYVRLGPSDAIFEPRQSGSLYVRNPHALGKYPRKLTERLDYWAEHSPDRTFLAQREASGAWRHLPYKEAHSLARNIAQALLQRELSAERPLAILSGNDIRHALLGLGALYAGIPYAPISPSYALLSSDFGKLRHIFSLLTPGLVFANGARYQRAIDAVVPPQTEVLSDTSLQGLLNTKATQLVDQAHDRISPDTIAKILFTSGSTALPKGVINTQRMLCSNQAMLAASLAFIADEPPVICDWLPWHHTFGGNHNFGLVLYNGGSLYIDGGGPMPDAMQETVKNLSEVAPTIYFNVPKGYGELMIHLRKNSALRERFFSRLKLMFYAAASLPQHMWDELEELSIKTRGESVVMLTSLGSTESAPFALCSSPQEKQAGVVGLPAPGVELKLVPVAGKLEARLRGPNITPGYWRQENLTRDTFDEEGFYRMGDALRFLDPDNPSRGFVFDGRMTEDFKLSTGTWVSVGPLREQFVAHCAPYVRDAVIAGDDRDEISALIFPDLHACKELCNTATGSPMETFSHSAVRSKFQSLLAELAEKGTGSSNRIVRALLLEEPPSIDGHEVTDKGSLNHREVLRRRANLVEELYAMPLSARVIAI